MTAYDRTVEWLYALEAAKGMDFKLERIALALERLGDPHRRYPTLHIAGTNGKGSVAAMLHAVLTAAGHRTGLYTSPHLVSLTERIRIGADEIAREDVVDLAEQVRAVAATRGIDLTFFEFLTVMAFLHFARAAVDVAVVEVGLGGRLDATNVVDPLASVITTIGLDHTQWLGDSLASIALEKGGIIKSGRPLVLGRLDPEAAVVLHRLAAERGAPVIAAGRDYQVSQRGPLQFDGLGWHFDDLRLGLGGAHQRDNAGTALATLAAVRDRLTINDDAVRHGLEHVDWPGRMEVLPGEPLTVLDGAHNADGAAVLAQELPALLGGRPMHLLFAVMGDKDWLPMIDRLAPLAESVVVTEVLPPRGAPAASVAAVMPDKATIEPDVRRAWQLVRARAGSTGAVLATGSLFLIGTLYSLGLIDRQRRGGATPKALHP